MPAATVVDGADLTDQAAFAGGVPYDVFARLRREAPVHWHPPGRSGSGFWVLSRHADIAAAASSPAFSAEGGGGRAGGGTHLEDLPAGRLPGVVVAMMDDPRHALIRDLLGPPLDAAALERATGDLRRCAAQVVAEALDRRTCDLAADVAGRFAAMATALMLGAPARDWDRLVGWAHRVSGLANRRTGRPDEESGRIGEEMRRYCEHLLAAASGGGRAGADLSSALALGRLPDAGGQPPLSRLEREANLLLLLLTGNEQPRNTAAGGVLGLIRHPEQWRALRADPALLPGAVEEMLRWAPPNPYNRRTVVHDLRFRGARMRAGDKVTLWWASANRDETVFTDASVFDVRREPNPHLSFGHGGHACLGARLARLELRLLMEELLVRVREVRLTGPVRWAPSSKHAVVLEMPVRLVPA
ncbi:cytochrome P450 [Actinomadura sp. KC06]|uniref:cytochrome P450 n=1 Tax=Actinomadura sp. KC06 TaxID=2530369 RepID=UPI00104BC863|nr:cytochrome P450 [Actinomadura sp. KC06]TDD30859.1 cytochrome P450 [Actinomadura sp. KC06]